MPNSNSTTNVQNSSNCTRILYPLKWKDICPWAEFPLKNLRYMFISLFNSVKLSIWQLALVSNIVSLNSYDFRPNKEAVSNYDENCEIFCNSQISVNSCRCHRLMCHRIIRMLHAASKNSWAMAASRFLCYICCAVQCSAHSGLHALQEARAF